MNIDFDSIRKRVEEVYTKYQEGTVKQVIGLTIEVQGVKALLGSFVQFIT